jgi:hypothetical protein
MKPQWQLLPCVVLCAVIQAGALAQVASSAPVGKPGSLPEDVRVELKKLLLADSARLAHSVAASAPTPAPVQGAAGAVVMSPYVVREERIQDPGKAVFEPPLERFLRDGTLYERVGRTFTTGLRLRFYSTDSEPDNPAPAMFGNVRPRNGAQLGLSWSW